MKIEEAFETMREEMLKLRALAFAVGRTDIRLVPEPIVQAWRAPAEYRADKLQWQADRISELEIAARRVIQHHDAGTLSHPGDSAAIDKLRALITKD